MQSIVNKRIYIYSDSNRFFTDSEWQKVFRSAFDKFAGTMYFYRMLQTEKEDFTQAVYQIVRLVPRGRATSYGALARAAGRPALSRMVGRIMCACGPHDLPAHRVVNAQGVLTASGKFRDMARLLESEGVAVENNRIRNWRQVFWDPMNEL